MDTDLINRLEDWKEVLWDAIKRMDMGEIDNGIMTQIRFDQHDILCKAITELKKVKT